jgi:hypothetical protein
MRKLKYILFYTLVFHSMSCHHPGTICDMPGSQTLELKPVSAYFTLPKFSIEDSMRFGKEAILSYKIKFADSTLSMNCFVTSNGNVTDAKFDLASLKKLQKDEVLFNRISPELLIDEIRQVNSTNIGYVKYLISMPSEKFYEGRIFFLKENKLVTIWIFERFKSDSYNHGSIIDCIVKSISIM